MRKIGIGIWIAVGIGTAHLGWVWVQRHAGDVRLAHTLALRNQRRSGGAGDSSGSVKITHFYAMSGEMTDADRTTICYGVQNAAAVHMEPPVENLWPTPNRCFWAEPRADTTYKLIAEGADGAEDTISFQVHVKPAPPAIEFMAVSHKEIVQGDAVTVCYGVSHAKAVRLDPVGWSLAPIAKNCARFYPPASLHFTLVAFAGDLKDTRSFDVRVTRPSAR